LGAILGVSKRIIYVIKQGDSERKVIILTGDISVTVRKNIVRRHMCLLANVYRDRAVWIYKYKANWMVTKEEKLPTDDFISFQLFALVNNSSRWKKKRIQTAYADPSAAISTVSTQNL